ncbi:glycoside hydrolase family 88 protein [Palleniella muris]|uniref:Glycoside hydrolase family 88 protein n=1 Tax=Palleniella muris TaxID=3038145 RepID=A0AC61QU29_9BACT|nr:glycoside hydrolase family 88 protein [Palleniella muris]
MKKIFLFIAFAAATLFSQAQNHHGQTNKDIMDVAVKVNAYFMKKNPDPALPTFVKRMRPSSLWTRAVYYEGLMALYEICPRQEYWDYAYTWADYHKWQPRNGNTTHHADDQCCLQTYIDLYRIAGDPKMIQGAKANMNMMLAYPTNEDWWWIDAVQMAMPIYTKLYSITKDERLLDKAWGLYSYTRNTLGDKGMYNEKEGLWWRDADFDGDYKEPNGKNCYWSRGNGWVIAALARVLDDLPKDNIHYKDYVKDMQTMAKAIKACQREDGFWNCSLHDPNNFGGKETSGTALFVYAMAWGIRNGILSHNDYYPVVKKAWDAIVKDAIHPNGYIGYVQGTGKEPKDGQPTTYDSHPDFEDYGTGCVLLAAAEMYKLK